MTTADKAVLVIGANRGIGQALVEEALTRGGVRVHAILTGPTDTDMTRGFEIPKASPESVARAAFDGVENGEEDIFPDPLSESLAQWWHGGVARALRHQYAALVNPERVQSAAA
jgi:NAD(P)-dependent dehydrogenase (short-subunit alcohol dehydrogenase family)